MSDKYAADELNNLSREQMMNIIISLQDQVTQMNLNMEHLIEQIRLADQYRFGRHTERLDEIAGQMNLFNEVETYADNSDEPSGEEVIITARKKKKKGQRDDDFKDLPREAHDHRLTDEQLDEFFGKDCWRRIKPDEYIRVRCQPAAYTVEAHSVDVAVGTKGDHQDEFLRGDRPKDLMRNSVATPSLMAAIMNTKYVNSNPLYRIENEFDRNGVHISRQTMANWVIRCSKQYFEPFIERLRQELLKRDVNQADETPVQVINDNDPDDPNDRKGSPGHKNFMWVHRSGELDKEPPIVLYEYQRTRHHRYPLEYYSGYKGVLMTDGLQQYHLLEKELEGLTSANCWAHARRDYADAIKAAAKKNPETVKNSVAYQALARIGTIYKIEKPLRDLTPEERLKERQLTIGPLVDEYFTWIKKIRESGTVLPKGKASDGINYSINQEKYLRVFLTNGKVPIDNSASERSIRTFCIGKKNWVFINSIKGAKASAAVYSICETAKLNNLNPYYYLDHLLTELPKLCDDDGNIDTAKLDPLLPWADELPAKCHKPRR